MTSPLSCPACKADITPAAGAFVSRCPRCGLRLVGPDAARLWQVEQQVAALQAEARFLLARLQSPAGPLDTGAPAGVPGPDGAPVPAQPGPGPRRSPTAPQILLALGALLLLSAVSFFLLVVWLVVGATGQSVIMAALTLSGVVGTAAATRRRLPAAAETGAVITSGLVVLDLWGAHRLDLAGLGSLDAATYWSLAGLVGAGLLLAADGVVRRAAHHPGARRVLTLRPAAVTLALVSPWSMVVATDPGPALLVGAFQLVLAVSVVVVLAARRVDDLPARVMGLPASALPAVASAVVAGSLYVVVGLATGLSPTLPALDRYSAALLLALVPAGLALLDVVLATRRPAWRDLLPPTSAVATGAVLLVPLVDAHHWALVVASLVLSALAVISHTVPTAHGPAGGRRWADPLLLGLWITQPVVVASLVLIDWSDATSLREMSLGVPATGPTTPVVAVAAGAWALSCVVAAAARASVAWLVVAEVAVAAAVAIALQDAAAGPWQVVGACGLLVQAALTAVAVRRSWTARGAVEVTSVVAGACYALVALAAGAAQSAGHLSASLAVLGAVICAWAALPRRLPMAYLGSFVLSAAAWVLLAEDAVDVVEAYSWPWAAMLGVLGLVQWRRRPSLSSAVTTGPALGVAIGPSLLVAVDDGDAVRLAAVTAVAVGLVVVGLARRLKGPVTVGSLALVVVAVTQGGPYLAYVPGWFTLGAAGAVLLAAGVAWEDGLRAGRRANRWYAALR